MNHLHWMKLYIGDELSNTSHMSPAEIGSYMLLKMHYWRFGCLPADDERLARIAKVSPAGWETIKPSIGPLFDDDWRDLKLEGQREEAEERHKKLSEAGKRGGRPRKDEKPSYKPGFSGGKASPKQPEPEPDSYSASEPNSEPDETALDKGKKEGDEREGMLRSFPKPPSISAGRQFLRDRGVPDDRIGNYIIDLMDGNLTPFDIEQFAEEQAA